MSGKYYQTLSCIKLSQLWHGSFMVNWRASYKNFQQKWLMQSKPFGNYLWMFSRSSVCPCAIMSASIFQSWSLHSTIKHEKGCVPFSFKWNINKGALRVLPLSKHRDDAVCKTKECLERQFTANNRKTAPKQKPHFHAIKNINPEADKKKKKLVFSSNYSILRLLSNTETKSLKYSSERTQELNYWGEFRGWQEHPGYFQEIHVDAVPGLPLCICSHFPPGGRSVPEGRTRLRRAHRRDTPAPGVGSPTQVA